MFIFPGGLKFLKEEEHLQLKRRDDAKFDFNYIVDSNNGEVVTEIVFGYYKTENFKQIIAIQTQNLDFNPSVNVTWKDRINITANLTSKAELKLTKVTDKTLFDITFYCNIKYGGGQVEIVSKIKLEIVCKYPVNWILLINLSPDFAKINSMNKADFVFVLSRSDTSKLHRRGSQQSVKVLQSNGSKM